MTREYHKFRILWKLTLSVFFELVSPRARLCHGFPSGSGRPFRAFVTSPQNCTGPRALDGVTLRRTKAASVGANLRPVLFADCRAKWNVKALAQLMLGRIPFLRETTVFRRNGA